MNYRALQDYRNSRLQHIGKCQEVRKVGLFIVISSEGEYKRIESRFENVPIAQRKKKTESNNKVETEPKTIEVAESIITPFHNDRTAKPVASLLCDNSQYVLGVKLGKDSQEVCEGKKTLFVDKIKTLCEDFPDNERFSAVRKFYEKDGVQQLLQSEDFELLKKKPNSLITFRLEGDAYPVTSDAALNGYYKAVGIDSNSARGGCIINPGKEDYIADIFPALSFYGGMPTALIPFQVDYGYDSYGWKQLQNAQMGIEAAQDIYVAVQNLLDDKRSNAKISAKQNKVFIFWTNASKEVDDASKLTAANCFNTRGNIEDAADGGSDENACSRKAVLKNLAKVKEAFGAVHTGKAQDLNKAGVFYIAGINVGKRVGIFMFSEISLTDFSKNIIAHLEDTKITGAFEEVYLGLYNMLCSIAPRKGGKADFSKLPGSIIERLCSSIFEGKPYPQEMLSCIMQRIRSQIYEKKDDNTSVASILPSQAGLIRGYINRKHKIDKLKNYTEMIDYNNHSEPYLLGRFLALADKIQFFYSKRNGGQGKSNIVSRFYAKASTNPNQVMPSLILLSLTHASELENANYWENEKADILDNLPNSVFSKSFTLEQQGEFALGYYHQKKEYARQAQLKKQEESASTSDENN